MAATKSENRHPLLTSTEIGELDELINVHRFNENAIRHTKSLGDLVGLTKFGIHLVRVEPGNETTQYHFHQIEEEFIYILSGKGITEIGEEKTTISAKVDGDTNVIALNADYVLDALGAISGEEKVRMELEGKMSPAVIKSSKDGDFVHLIMPLKM